MTVPPPPPTDDREGLDAAKQKLSEAQGRPFEVDKILAQNRARQAQEEEARKRAEAKLEAEHKAGRERRHAILASELEAAKRAKEKGLVERQVKAELDAHRRDTRAQKQQKISQDAEGGTRH